MPTPPSHATELLAGLPSHLLERARILKDTPTPNPALNPPPSFVLYWMHHAARGHENPALNTAVLIANQLGLPVLVYQGLAGNHRFNNDRHHTFIMQGARDASAELTARNIRHAFYLPTNPAAPSPLRDLLAQAAALIVEDFPAPPFPQWTAALAARSTVPVFAVDSCCVVPMQRVRKPYDRAFAFRDNTTKDFHARLNQTHPDIQPTAPLYSGPLPFTPLDWTHTHIPAAATACAIDHTIPPVPHTEGGSIAGYTRWNAFKSTGLRTYASKRNDAAIDGVSRMSAYLHHGHVSPFRIARETAALAGPGPEKFIDELFVWRELAHNLCFHHHAALESLRILPAWAQRTLADHAKDKRPSTFSWETLARAQTSAPGHKLWNACQRSLLIHGELHNNVRMTWAKAIPEWSASPTQALQTLIDLNHRFALDGNNPNSYGGLLWALGLFDRPFEPEQPILGTVRPRPLTEHESRIDLPRYTARTARPALNPTQPIAIVGAGIAGAAALRTITDQSLPAIAFDKGRGPGGRASTRRESIANTNTFFDHGAQYFTARDPRFRRFVQSWVQDNIAQPWTATTVTISNTGTHPSPTAERFVGTGGTNALVKHLTANQPVRFGKRVTAITGSPGHYTLTLDDNSTQGPFHHLIIALPAPQAAELLRPIAPNLADLASHANMLPCWTLMLALDAPSSIPYHAAKVQSTTPSANPTANPIAWFARENSKPGRPATPECWTIQATPAWSQANLERPAEEVAQDLLAAFRSLTNLPDSITPLHAAAHRWRYARAADALSPAIAQSPLYAEGALHDPARNITLCGDWLLGPRIECAFLSGCAAAGRIMSTLSANTTPAHELPPAQPSLF